MSDYPSTDSIMSELSSESSKAGSEQAAAETPSASQAPQEFEYTIEGGKKVKEPLEMVLKRAGMGYHYAQQMHAINQEREKYKGYDEKFQTYEQEMAKLRRWQEYDDFARQNPEWARHVEETWNSRENLQQSNEVQQNPELESLKAELAELKQFRESLALEKQQAQFAAEDKQFAGEIEETAKKFGVDLSQADEQGRSLEWRVLEHMSSMGLDGSKPGHFRAAFKDFYLDNLLDRQKEQVKEQTAKQEVDMRKAGILGVSRTPQSVKAFNPKQHSWNELGEMALADLQKGG